MDQLIELAIFFGKSVIIILTIGAILILFVSAALKNKPPKEYLEVERLNYKFDNYKSMLQNAVLSKKELKQVIKAEKKAEKYKDELDAKKSTVYVIDFNGDIKASAVDRLRDEISAILTVAKETDSVLAKIESPGGAVHSYGLAASQLNRIRNAKIQLIVSVDLVAASGGYMMACVANKIIAAPFAILGSIGVIAQVPNFNKLLKKHDVEYEEITSGEFKRTVSLFGENTEKGKKKFAEQIEQTHLLFKDFVSQYRPQLNLAEVATGEYWFGLQALKLNLIDEVKTSDEFLFEHKETTNLIKVTLQERKTLKDVLGESMKALSGKLLAGNFLKREISENNFPPTIS